MTGPGDEQVRLVAGADVETRELVCVASVPRGSLTWFMEGDEGRGVREDGGLGRETTRLAASAGGAPVAGFYTYGEIARTSGTSGFHNQTLVVLAVG